MDISELIKNFMRGFKDDHKIIIWLISFLTFLSIFNIATPFIPIFSGVGIPLSAILSTLVWMIMLRKPRPEKIGEVNKPQEEPESSKSINVTTMITIAGGLIVILIILVYVFSQFVPSKGDFQKILDNQRTAGLNPTERRELEEAILKVVNDIKKEEEKREALNSEIVDETVNRILAERNFLNRDEVQKLVEEIIVGLDSKYVKKDEGIPSLPTLTPQDPSCLITPLNHYPSVAIRKSPIENATYIDTLYQGRQMFVIGHNGGEVNRTRWWLVQVDDNVYGWINSSVVTEIDEVNCMRLKQFPGY